jgi:hypothetical protein
LEKYKRPRKELITGLFAYWMYIIKEKSGASRYTQKTKEEYVPSAALLIALFNSRLKSSGLYAHWNKNHLTE